MKTFCIIEVGHGAPIYGSMDTPESCLEHHRIAQRRLGLLAREDLDVWEGDPRGEDSEAPRKVGTYSETYGLWKYPTHVNYTLNGEVIDYNTFLRERGIGYGPEGAQDPVYRAILDLNPGESYTKDGWTLAMLPYDGDYKGDLKRQVVLAQKDVLTEKDKKELRLLGEKIQSYMFGPKG